MNIWIEPVRSLVLRKTPHNKVNSYVYTITCTFPQCFGQYIPSQSKLLYNSSLRLPGEAVDSGTSTADTEDLFWDASSSAGDDSEGDNMTDG